MVAGLRGLGAPGGAAEARNAALRMVVLVVRPPAAMIVLVFPVPLLPEPAQRTVLFDNV